MPTSTMLQIEGMRRAPLLPPFLPVVTSVVAALSPPESLVGALSLTSEVVGGTYSRYGGDVAIGGGNPLPDAGVAHRLARASIAATVGEPVTVLALMVELAEPRIGIGVGASIRGLLPPLFSAVIFDPVSATGGVTSG